MANVTNSSDEIVGVSNNNIPTGTYTDASGTHTYADIYGGMSYDGATNTKGQLTLTGIDDNTTVTSITVTDTVTALKADGTSAGTTSVVPVTVTQNGSSWQATTANSTVLPDGDHSFTVTFKNAAGTTVATETYNELVRHSTGGNAVPTAPALTAISDSEDPSGAKSPNIIPNHGVTFSGTADAYALINVYVGTSPNGGGQLVADQVQADSTGHWTVVQDASRGTLPETSGQLTYVQVTATDLAGNSAANGTTSYVVDTTAPTLAFTAVNYTDSSGGSHDTNVSPVTFSGTVSDDHTVDSVVVNTMTNGVVTGHIAATLNADGTWTASGMLANEGTKSYSVTATDEVGNTTTTSNATTFVYDHTAPTVSANLHYTNTDLTHSTTVDQTSNGTVNLTATVSDALSAIKSVEVFDTVTANGVTTTVDLGAETIVTGTGAAGTTTTYGLNPTLGQGTHVIHEVVIDIAGNVTTEPTYTPLTVDLTAPTIASATETYTSAVGAHTAGATVTGLTNDPNVTVTVNTADSGGSTAGTSAGGVYSVEVFDNAGAANQQDLGAATYNAGTGLWTYNTSSLSQGAHNLSAAVTDAVSNTTSTGQLGSFTIDTIAPVQPSVGLAVDSGTQNNDLYTNNDTITSNAEAGSTVRFYFDGSATAVTATADGNGVATVDPQFAANGLHTAYVTATDAAGNTSVQSPTLTFTYDTAAPTASITGGTALTVANSTTTLNVAFSELPKNADGSAVALTTANFTAVGGVLSNLVKVDNTHYTIQLTDTTHSNAIRDTVTFGANQYVDQAGNGNTASNIAVVTGDTIAPVAPVITDVDSTGGTSTTTTPVVVSGHAEAGATVILYDAAQNDFANYPVNGGTASATASASTMVGTGIADANGNFSIVLSNPLVSDETHVFTATATDAVGNVSVNALTVAAAVLSPADSYGAASALNKNIAPTSAIGTAIGHAPYFVVGDGASADLINAGRSGYQVINDEHSVNSTITVGTSTFSVVHGGVGATITAGSGTGVFVIDDLGGTNTASPDGHAQSIGGFSANDKIDISQILTALSSVEIDQTTNGSTLIVHGGIGGTTTVNVDGAHLTAGQVITATSDVDYYLNTQSVASATTAALITSVAIDGTRTEVASLDAKNYAISLDDGTGYITHNGAIATLAGVEQVTFADGTLYYGTDTLAAQVNRLHLAAFGSLAAADDLASGVAFLAGGHTLAQLATSYLSATLAGEASLTNQQFVDLSYQNAVGRAADASGEAAFTNALTAGSLSRAGLLAEFSQSAEAHTLTDSAATQGLFAQSNTTSLYELLLGRDPTSTELAAGISMSLNKHDQGVQLAATQTFHDAVVANEGSYSNTTIVDFLYENVLHRHADASGLATFSAYLGTPGVTPADVALVLASSDEATAAGSSIQQALANGVQDVRAPIHADELLKAIFATGTTDSRFTTVLSDLQHGATVGGEATTLIATSQALTNDSTADFVNAIYTTALGRNVDASGAAFWTDQINNHGLSKGAFVADIINSVEFQSHYDPHAALAAAPAIIAH